MQRYITNCLREKIRQHNAKQEDVKRFLVELNQRVQDRLNQLMIEEMHLKSILRCQMMDTELQEQDSNEESKITVGPEGPNRPAGEPLQEELNLGVNDWHCEFFSGEEEEEDDDEDREEGAKDANQLDCNSDEEHLESFPPNIRSEALQVMHQLLKRHDERMNQDMDSMDEDPDVTSQAFQNLVSSESDSSDQEMPAISEQQSLVLLNKQQTSKAQSNSSVSEVDTDKENESL